MRSFFSLRTVLILCGATAASFTFLSLAESRYRDPTVPAQELHAQLDGVSALMRTPDAWQIAPLKHMRENPYSPRLGVKARAMWHGVPVQVTFVEADTQFPSFVSMMIGGDQQKINELLIIEEGKCQISYVASCRSFSDDEWKAFYAKAYAFLAAQAKTVHISI